MGLETLAQVWGANKAAGAQKDATADSNATLRGMYDQTRADNMQALTSRNAALAELSRLLRVGGDPSSVGYGSLAAPVSAGDVQNEAGYQFGLNQGLGSLNNQLAARGMRNSGAALKAATRYGNDYASTKYGDAFNREITNRNALLNPLQNLASAGQAGASTIAQSGNSTASGVAQNQGALGNALGASYLAKGNILNNQANQVAGWYMKGGM